MARPTRDARVRDLSVSCRAVDVSGEGLILMKGSRHFVIDKPEKLRLLEMLLDGELRAEMVRRGEVVAREPLSGVFT